ncbi:MAG: hypothetical protein HC921_11680 [Synechococcaceae cyanobacterium SM2_3_1]|nr:hypothetical protein [Synechococcaceae cyanobacterium SM2_3_1]
MEVKHIVTELTAKPEGTFLRKLRGGAIIGIGYMLSPLSWWNDLFFNLPIALLLGYALSWLNSDWFLPGTVIGYWISNVVGIVMMQFGAVDMFLGQEKRNTKRDLLVGLGGSTLYTLVIAILVYFHLLNIPDFLLTLQH